MNGRQYEGVAVLTLGLSLPSERLDAVPFGLVFFGFRYYSQSVVSGNRATILHFGGRPTISLRNLGRVPAGDGFAMILAVINSVGVGDCTIP